MIGSFGKILVNFNRRIHYCKPTKISFYLNSYFLHRRECANLEDTSNGVLFRILPSKFLQSTYAMNSVHSLQRYQLDLRHTLVNLLSSKYLCAGAIFVIVPGKVPATHIFVKYPAENYSSKSGMARHLFYVVYDILWKSFQTFSCLNN